MIKTYATEIERGKKYFYRPGVYVILPLGRQILLTFQADPHNEFQLPGGGVDAGEQPITALYREVMEETGWIIGRPKKIGAFRRFVYMPEYNMRAEKLCHIYLAKPILKKSEPTEADHTAVFVDIDVAYQILAVDGDSYFLKKFVDGAY